MAGGTGGLVGTLFGVFHLSLWQTRHSQEITPSEALPETETRES